MLREVECILATVAFLENKERRYVSIIAPTVEQFVDNIKELQEQEELPASVNLGKSVHGGSPWAK